jgi:hypothetical protein
MRPRVDFLVLLNGDEETTGPVVRAQEPRVRL